jgi:Leucine-rich repeat (LRR) protein
MAKPKTDPQMKDMYLFGDDEIYAEALRRIKEYGEKDKNKLDFSRLSLKTIPPEIAGLKTLAELDISGSSLGEIPDFIGNIRSLRRLSLGSRHSSAHDSEVKRIVLPKSLAKLTNLENIYLGYGIEIPEWLWDMDSLNALSICNDRIETLPAGIGNLRNLRSLRIHGSKISALPDEIGRCLTLTVIDLKCPRLTEMPASFSNLKTMKALSVTDCNFSAFPDFICEWTELERIVLKMYNTFQGPVTKLTKIPENIGNLRKLRTLDLDAVSLKKLPLSLCECPLEYLSVSGDFRTLPDNFWELTSLKKLELNGYRLKTLPLSFGTLLSLEEFSFYGGDLEELPETFCNLSYLKKLSIVTGKNLILPETFGWLPALEKLYINAEKMTSLPESIGGCTTLKSFTIESDALTELPRSFVKLVNLETFHADTFNLEKFPAGFGNLVSLKNLYIFSGALTAFPKSIGRLRNLKSLYLDAHNVQSLPVSFWGLPYIRDKTIIIGGAEQEMLRPSRRHTGKNADFENLKKMSYRYRWKILEIYSLKELETLIVSAPGRRKADETEKEIVGDMLRERRRRLNRKFKWTPENIDRAAAVSDMFLAAWEEGYAKAKFIIDALYEKETDKAAFWEKYEAEIILDPEILFPDTETGEPEYPRDNVYEVLMDYLDSEFEMNISINGDEDYNPVTKEERGFRENIHICRDLSWNIEGFGDIDLAGKYICYALHILYSDNEWANEDILKINSISSQVRITSRYDAGRVNGFSP